MITQKDFQKMTKQFRKSQKWSLEKLAGEIDCSRQTIKNIELGKHAPSFEVSQRLLNLVKQERPDLLPEIFNGS